jgi:hypothetical protein
MGNKQISMGVKTPLVKMYAIRKIPKNVPDFKTLTYWKEELELKSGEEIVEVTIKPWKSTS